MSEPCQTEDEEEDLLEATGTIVDPMVTPGEMWPRLIPAIPLTLFASTAGNQDTSLGTALNDVEDETKPTTLT
jgi:hypothetical protein